MRVYPKPEILLKLMIFSGFDYIAEIIEREELKFLQGVKL